MAQEFLRKKMFNDWNQDASSIENPNWTTLDFRECNKVDGIY